MLSAHKTYEEYPKFIREETAMKTLFIAFAIRYV